MIDLRDLEGTIDLWLCMWDEAEEESFETGLVRAMTDAHEPRIRALAFAAANVIATPRLLAAAVRLAESGVLPAEVVSAIELDTLPLFKLMDAAMRMRGNVQAVEHLLRKVVSGLAHESESRLCDLLDLRDLVTVARTTVDARLFAEIERRVASRGRYQRARAAHVLGFRARLVGGDSPGLSPISGG